MERYAPLFIYFLFGLYRNVSEIIFEILHKAIKCFFYSEFGFPGLTILCNKRENQCGKGHVILYGVHCFSVSFSILGANSADDKLISFLSFPRK